MVKDRALDAGCCAGTTCAGGVLILGAQNLRAGGRGGGGYVRWGGCWGPQPFAARNGAYDTTHAATALYVSWKPAARTVSRLIAESWCRMSTRGARASRTYIDHEIGSFVVTSRIVRGTRCRRHRYPPPTARISGDIALGWWFSRSYAISRTTCRHMHAPERASDVLSIVDNELVVVHQW